MRIIELYLKLKEATKKEQEYISENIEYDDKILGDLVTNKRILRDKIEKEQKQNKILESQLDEVKSLIEDIIVIEEENRKIYFEKLNNTKNNIENTVKEKQLKNTYFKKGIIFNKIDKKQ
ncbi:hypothetical protein [Haliovirga abyssi]|uniref:Flagellar protein FliT n=1 Tax=Haliovirga abyssi TaxID=2996794 RepID=A0AAU9DX53_9FUSO|nr:hypothetical protein [Haliovirga abyssi]BDU49910.1 hypothetical protein HLVA_04790 [Haliovirga abyssi]